MKKTIMMIVTAAAAALALNVVGGQQGFCSNEAGHDC